MKYQTTKRIEALEWIMRAAPALPEADPRSELTWAILAENPTFVSLHDDLAGRGALDPERFAAGVFDDDTEAMLDRWRGFLMDATEEADARLAAALGAEPTRRFWPPSGETG